MNDNFSFKDKCQLVLYLIDKIEDYWKRLFYSTMTIIGALFGGAYTKLNSLIIVSVIGVMFIFYTISNMLDHLRVYDFLILTIDEIKKDGEKLQSVKLLKRLSDTPYKNERLMCYVSYIGVMICVVVICILLKTNEQ